MTDIAERGNALPTFDPDALYVALDRVRRKRRMQWRQVACEAGVSASTLTRIGQGRTCNADGLVRLLAWLGTTDIGPFTTKASNGPDGDRWQDAFHDNRQETT